METDIRPGRLFRYLSPHSSHIFQEQKLWFSNASDFNDIFEMCPRFDKLIPKLIDNVLQREYAFLPPEDERGYAEFKRSKQDLVQNIIAFHTDENPEVFQKKVGANFGIVCFSENLESLLMWGHYTNCHHGFVVEFDPQHSLFSPRNFERIVYDKNRPSADLNSDARMLLIKSPEWSYELEHRLIKSNKELIPETLERNGIALTRYYMPLPMEAVKAVYFGFRISEQDRNKLLKPLESYPNIKRFQMKRHSLEYKLVAVP